MQISPIIPQSESEWQDGLANFQLMYVLYKGAFALVVPTDETLSIENEYTTPVFIYPHAEIIEVDTCYFNEGNDIALIYESKSIGFILNGLLDGCKTVREGKVWREYTYSLAEKHREADRKRQQQQEESDWEDGRLNLCRDENTGDYYYERNPRFILDY